MSSNPEANSHPDIAEEKVLDPETRWSQISSLEGMSPHEAEALKASDPKKPGIRISDPPELIG